MLSRRKNAPKLKNLLTNEKKLFTSLEYDFYNFRRNTPNMMILFLQKSPKPLGLGILSRLPSTFWHDVNFSGVFFEGIHKYYLLERNTSCLYVWQSSVKSNKPLVHSTFLPKLAILEHFEMKLIVG